MYSSGGLGGAHGHRMSGEDSRLKDYLTRAEQQARDIEKLAASKDERKKLEKKMKEAETKAFLDQQVALKHERREMEKEAEERNAKIVHADVQAFEKSKRDHKIEHRTKMNAHLELLVK